MTKALAVAVLCVIWGSTWLVIKVGLSDLPTFTSAAIRFSIAALIFAAVAGRLHRIEGGQRPPWHVIAVTGGLNFAVCYGIVYWAEGVIPSGLTSVLWATFPMFAAGFAHRYLPGERIVGRRWLGFIVGFAGVGSLFATDLRQLGSDAVVAGAVLLASPLLAAVGNTVAKRHAAASSATLLNRSAMPIGAGLLWIAALATEDPSAIVLTPTAVASLLYLALAGTVVAFGVYYWLLRHVDASTLSLIAYVNPAIALWLGTLVAGEPVAWTTVTGTLLIVLGLALAVRKKR